MEVNILIVFFLISLVAFVPSSLLLEGLTWTLEVSVDVKLFSAIAIAMFVFAILLILKHNNWSLFIVFGIFSTILAIRISILDVPIWITRLAILILVCIGIMGVTGIGPYIRTLPKKRTIVKRRILTWLEKGKRRK